MLLGFRPACSVVFCFRKMKPDVARRHRQKVVEGTNIVVQNVSIRDEEGNTCRALLHAIEADDEGEVKWWDAALRPKANLVNPSVAFLRGIKTLRPATHFNTFDLKKSRLRRLEKQKKDRERYLARREREIAPTAAMKASLNPHKVPRTGGHSALPKKQHASVTVETSVKKGPSNRRSLNQRKDRTIGKGL
uniref:Uncharacterized protein n=1 Tax=Trypanosoma congolense (strain IL3000) TaxID=1068625 RepID=G0UTY7_TRYCI|nr:conserved hypothetical protein [Trypanosoma congolense IL3000]